MSTPLVSVIVPLYNYEIYVSDCIQSILNQTYENIEVIVVDDCSTDSSFEVANRFACDNVKVMHLEENSGYSKAKNEGIIASAGEYIVTLDADDMLTKKSIAKRVNAALRFSVNFIHARAITVHGKISLEECYVRNSNRRQKPRIHAQTVLMHRNIHRRFGLYDEKLRSRSDKEMWWRLFGKNDEAPQKVKRKFIPVDVAYYRQHKSSMIAMRSRNKKYDKKISKLLEEQYRMRQKQGITPENTRMLET